MECAAGLFRRDRVRKQINYLEFFFGNNVARKIDVKSAEGLAFGLRRKKIKRGIRKRITRFEEAELDGWDFLGLGQLTTNKLSEAKLELN